MAAGKRKVLVRLERGAGEARVFWEIRRERTLVTTRFGRHLGAGRTIVKEHETSAAAAAVFDKAIEEKRREGYAEPMLRAEVGATSRKGVSARSPELEAIVEEAPHDPEGYLVYADWLQQHGDPRGELIVMQHRLATTRDRHELALLEREQAALFKKFDAELLGPLAKYVFIRSSVQSYRAFSWRCGFIRIARLGRIQRRAGAEGIAQVLDHLFAHPSGRFLERLILGGYEPETAFDIFYRLEKSAPPTLVSIVFGDGAHVPTYIEPIWSALPRMRSLELLGRIDDFGAVRGDALRVLRVGWAEDDILRSIARSIFPSLATLHLTLPLRPSAPFVGDILRGDAAPALERLTARRWVADERPNGGSVLVPQGELALEVARAAAGRRLRRLDLEMPLGDEGVDKLLAHARELRAIGELRVPRNGVSTSRRTSLSSALPGLSWTGPPEEGELELDEIDERPAPWDPHARGRANEADGAAPAPLSSRAEPR